MENNREKPDVRKPEERGELFYIPLFKIRIAINSLLRSEVNMITFSYILLVVICIFAIFIPDLIDFLKNLIKDYCMLCKL